MTWVMSCSEGYVQRNGGSMCQWSKTKAEAALPFEAAELKSAKKDARGHLSEYLFFLCLGAFHRKSQDGSCKCGVWLRTGVAGC